jgi:hypothetical protein
MDEMRIIEELLSEMNISHGIELSHEVIEDIAHHLGKEVGHMILDSAQDSDLWHHIADSLSNIDTEEVIEIGLAVGAITAIVLAYNNLKEGNT